MKFLQPFNTLPKKYFSLLVLAESILFILAWFKFGMALIPTPFEVLSTIIELLKSSIFYESLVTSGFLTIKAMFCAALIALIFSYGYFINLIRPLSFFVLKFRFVPLSGLVFLFTLMTSTGSELKLWLLIFGMVPFFTTSLISNFDSINTQEYDLCKTLRMNSWRMWFEVVIMGRLDQVVETMRQNFAITWLMITMIEGLSMSEGGLGVMLIKTNRPINLSKAFALLIVIFFVGMLFDLLLGKIRTWLFPYTNLEVLK